MPATATEVMDEVSTPEAPETETPETPSRVSRVLDGVKLWLLMTYLTLRASVVKVKTGSSTDVPMSSLMRIAVSLTVVLVGAGLGWAVFSYLPWQYGLGVVGLFFAVGEIPKLVSLSHPWKTVRNVRKVAFRVVAVCIVFALGVATMRYANAIVFGLVCVTTWLAMSKLLGLEAAATMKAGEDDEEVV